MANNKAKRISVNAFEKAMEATYTPADTFDWNGIEVTVKVTLSLKEMLEFVDYVVRSCLNPETGVYIPEITEFAAGVCVLEKYANFTLPKNVEAQYALIYQTDAVECVLGHINSAQYDEIRRVIEKKLRYAAEANIESLNRQMNTACDAIENLGNKMTEMFSGVSAEDIKAVAGSISNGAVDEKKLVAAYMKNKAVVDDGDD